jgi:hypothetical protein
MKKKFIIALSAMLVFGLVAVVYAYNRTETTAKSVHSCPMKSETASADKKDSCCGMADCCKDGKCKMDGACCKDHDACPMKDKQTAEKQSADYSKITVSDDSGEDCCGSGASCCDGGACCKGKHG